MDKTEHLGDKFSILTPWIDSGCPEMCEHRLVRDGRGYGLAWRGPLQPTCQPLDRCGWDAASVYATTHEDLRQRANDVRCQHP